MQLKVFCPLLLLGLLHLTFAGPNGAADRHGKQLMSSFGRTKRATTFGIGSMSHVRGIQARGLSKRATICDTGSFACTEFEGSCCKDGTYCTMIGAEVGCCAIGKICDSLCLEGETACGSVCCPKGQDCSTDEVCVTGSGSGEVCGGQAGFAQCSNMDGCCPEGVKCLPPDSCDIQCTASDPVCGTSCCLGGSVCVNDSTCVVDSGSGGSSASFTPVATTSGSSSATKTAISDTTSSTSSNESSGETTKTTKKTTTKKTTTTDDSTTPTDTTTGATRSTKVNVKTQTVTPNNAASFPTMAAMLGGGLGGIAAGYLAM